MEREWPISLLLKPAMRRRTGDSRGVSVSPCQLLRFAAPSPRPCVADFLQESVPSLTPQPWHRAWRLAPHGSGYRTSSTLRPVSSAKLGGVFRGAQRHLSHLIAIPAARHRACVLLPISMF